MQGERDIFYPHCNRVKQQKEKTKKQTSVVLTESVAVKLPVLTSI